MIAAHRPRMGLRTSLNSVTVANKVKEALKERFRVAGVRNAKITTEAVPMSSLRRLIVVTSAFAEHSYPERQAIVWEVAHGALTPAEVFLITQIVTITPAEKSGKLW